MQRENPTNEDNEGAAGVELHNPGGAHHYELQNVPATSPFEQISQNLKVNSFKPLDWQGYVCIPISHVLQPTFKGKDKP